jgi:hypothetical protein
MRLPPGIPCNETLSTLDTRDLSPNEKATFKVLTQELRRWKRILKMDPLWEIYAVVLPNEQMGAASAATDIGESEYYRCTIFVRHEVLDLAKESDRFREMRRIACHELLHASTADYQRMAIVTCSPKVREELNYRYEQMVVRQTAVLVAQDEKLRKKERKKDDEPPDPGSSEAVL